jgi:poly-gamma-glutamate synthesis protein (capsule biosynthesis protein)
LLISSERGRARARRRRPGAWFVRRSPDDSAGVLSPPATIVVVLALMVVVALSIRSVRADATGTGTGTAGTGPDPEPAVAHLQRPPPTAPVTLAFGGDVHFEKWLDQDVRDEPAGALRALEPLFADADLAVVNLETAVTERGTPAAKTHTFRGPREGLTALAAAGVDVVSIANNHGMDFGRQGLVDTLEAGASAGLAVVGGGRDESEAYRPHVVDVHGRRVAVIGATQVLDTSTITEWTAGPETPGLASAKPDADGLPRLTAAIREAARDADTVAVMMHWGEERRQCPPPHQEELAEQLRAAGADIIVGGHAHRLAAGGYLGDAVVHYGLGNLVFYATDGPATASGALAVTIAPDDTTTMAWRPATLRGGIATPITGAGADAIAGWDALRSCTGLLAQPQASTAGP